MSVLLIDCFANLQLSHATTTRRRSPRVSAQQKAKEARDRATNIINNDGLFVNIASYCGGLTLARLCTASKVDTERRCRLAVTQALPYDPRRVSVVEKEGWDNVLRERVSLRSPLKFTSVPEGGGGRRNKRRLSVRKNVKAVLESPKVDDDDDYGSSERNAGVVCGGPQVMRQGVHRAVLWGYCKSRRFEIGVVPPSEAHSRRGRVRSSSEGAKFSRSFELLWDEPERLFFMIGLEFDCETKALTAYRFKHVSNSNYGHWEEMSDKYYSFNGDIVTKSRSTHASVFYWAAESSGQGDETTIQRHDGPFQELLQE